MADRTPFRIMNRTVNRLLRALLRSPLHAIASGRIALLTYTGRRSGREYTLPVLYHDDGGEISVTVNWPDRKVWWRNLTGEGGRVGLLVRGEQLTGHAVATRDGEQDPIVRIELDDAEHSRPRRPRTRLTTRICGTERRSRRVRAYGPCAPRLAQPACQQVATTPTGSSPLARTRGPARSPARTGADPSRPHQRTPRFCHPSGRGTRSRHRFKRSDDRPRGGRA